jgi:hypothetical protein
MKTFDVGQVDRVEQRRPPRLRLDQVDLVDVGAEQQERGQRRRGDRVALGQGLGRVADGVEAVGDLAAPASARLNSAMPPALSVIGPNVSMARM